MGWRRRQHLIVDCGLPAATSLSGLGQPAINGLARLFIH
jgi:hypothetical protein